MKEAIKYCYYLLGRKEYTRSEVSQKVQRKFAELSLDDINSVIDKLVEKGFISDERYTEIYVRTKIGSGWGKSKIVFNLKDKGVEKEIIEKILSEFEIDLENLKAILLRKYKNELEKEYKGEEKFKFKNKMLRFLASRGHKFEDCKVVVEGLMIDLT